MKSMMAENSNETNYLLQRAAGGDQESWGPCSPGMRIGCDAWLPSAWTTGCRAA